MPVKAGSWHGQKIDFGSRRPVSDRTNRGSISERACSKTDTKSDFGRLPGEKARRAGIFWQIPSIYGNLWLKNVSRPGPMSDKIPENQRFCAGQQAEFEI